MSVSTSVWLSIVSGIFLALYATIDRGILKSLYHGKFINYNIFSTLMGSGITFLAIAGLSSLGISIGGFAGLALPPAHVGTWVYLLAASLFGAVFTVLYFVVLLHRLGSVYYGVFQGFSVVYVVILGMLPKPWGIGESPTWIQLLAIGVALFGTSLCGLERGSNKDARAGLSKDLLFITLFILLAMDVPLAFYNYFNKKVFDLGTIDPISYRVWQFIVLALFASVLSVSFSGFLGRARRRWGDRWRGVNWSQFDVASWATIRSQTTRKVLMMNIGMHLCVLVSSLAFYLAIFRDPISLALPIQQGSAAVLVWLLFGLVRLRWPGLYQEMPTGLSHFLGENWHKLLGTFITAIGLAGLVAFSSPELF